MGVEMNIVYQGELRCQATHGPSGASIVTDAPVDNHGKGQAFSPTDLVGVALGACMLTTMGIVAQRDGIDLKNSKVRVVKEMITSPSRRIGSLSVEMELPETLNPEQRQKMENAAKACPVHKSMHPDVKMPITFRYTAR